MPKLAMPSKRDLVFFTVLLSAIIFAPWTRVATVVVAVLLAVVALLGLVAWFFPRENEPDRDE